MADPNNPLIAALRPLARRVRRDVTAVKRAGGAQAWTREPLTVETLARHLNGGPARGVSFIKPGESVTLVALLDFDSHGGETPWGEMCAVAANVVDVLGLAWGAEPLAFRSSGGRGIHIYLVWDEPQDARSVRAWLAGVLAACGLKNGTKGVQAGQVEIFPKQASVPVDGFGNQVILPGSGASELLEMCDLSGILVPAGRQLRAEDWRASPAVPEAPPEPERAASTAALDGAWVRALAALTNAGPKELGYDDWFRVVSAVHFETKGEGLALAHEFSARSSKHAPDFLDTRVWPYLSDRENGNTGRTIMSLAARLEGWTEPLDVEAFPVIPDPGPLARGVGEMPEREGLPEAKHMCTDQANANRLVSNFGRQMLVAAGHWYVWDGRRWARDEASVYRLAMQLSALVKAEAAQHRAKAQAAGPDPAALKKADELATALEKWSSKCEMKGTIDAAVTLVKKTLTVEPEFLDADPWVLNVRNGVIDLRTGILRPHDAGMLCTRLVDIDYDPEARCEAWERALLQITCEDAPGAPAPIAAFLQRWAGYCLTGSVREQVFVTHCGGGSNGKSTIIDTLARVSGDYAAGAPSGLLTETGRGGDLDATRMSVLLGKRVVTAHETKATSELRDDFIKSATGTDRITGRFLYGEPFDFEPTHKLQLLTNHKPVVKTQDHGMWRRVVLVPYAARFGSAEDVAAGHATHVKDMALPERLGTPEALRGVLAWAVRGAVEWAREGLQVPDVVRAASAEYRNEMDRVGQFAAECCELGPGFSEPLTLSMGGLYPAYSAWCKDSGTHPLARGKFLAELQRATGCEVGATKTERTETGRRAVTRVHGLRLMQE